MQVRKNLCDVRAGMTENTFRPTILNGFLILKIKIPKGQIISKGLFGVLKFSQKTNERIRFNSKNLFVFERIRGYQKVLSKLSDLYQLSFK